MPTRLSVRSLDGARHSRRIIRRRCPPPPPDQINGSSCTASRYGINLTFYCFVDVQHRDLLYARSPWTHVNARASTVGCRVPIVDREGECDRDRRTCPSSRASRELLHKAVHTFVISILAITFLLLARIPTRCEGQNLDLYAMASYDLAKRSGFFNSSFVLRRRRGVLSLMFYRVAKRLDHHRSCVTRQQSHSMRVSLEIILCPLGDERASGCCAQSQSRVFSVGSVA